MGIVYLATNKETGKEYIGTSQDELPNTKEKLLRYAKAGGSLPIHQALLVGGLNSFSWIVLERESDAVVLERKALKFMKAYNTFEPNGYNKPIDISPTGPTKTVVEKIIKPRVRREMSQETRTKIGQANRDRNRVVTDETRKKLSERAYQRWKSREEFMALSPEEQAKIPEEDRPNIGRPRDPESATFKKRARREARLAAEAAHGD